MNSPQYIELLEKCDLFAGMKPAELDATFASMKYEEFGPGVDILSEGLTYASLWIIVSGRCEVLKAGKHGDSSQLAQLEAGSVFGEMSFLETAPHSATIRTLTDVTTMRLPREAFDSLRAETPAASEIIACNIVTLLSRRLRRMDDWTCDLVHRNCTERQHDEWHEFRAKLYSGLEI